MPMIAKVIRKLKSPEKKISRKMQILKKRKRGTKKTAWNGK